MSLQSAVSGANIGAAQQESSKKSQSFGLCAGLYIQNLGKMTLIWWDRLGVWVTVPHLSDRSRTKVDAFVRVCLKEQGKLVKTPLWLYW